MSTGRAVFPDVAGPVVSRDPASIGWVVALGAFGVFDVVITVLAITAGIAAEANPIVQTAIERVGLAVLPVWKAVALAAFYGLYRATPKPYDVGVPIGLSITGVATALWNLSIVFIALE